MTSEGAELDGVPIAPEGPVAPVSSDEPVAPAEDDPVPSDEGGTVPADEPSSESTPPAVEDEPPAPELCPGISEPTLLDFETPGNDPTQALFGDFREALSGGTFIYPTASAAAEGASVGLVSDVTNGDWHITGTVASQSGFGLFFACQLLDASAFAGLAFTVSGDIEGATSLGLIINTAGNDVSPSWRILNGQSPAPSFGRCTPAESEFDGTCDAARIDIALEQEPREVTVLFSELGGGAPEALLNPSEITKIAWSLPGRAPDASGTVEPYAVDIRIDDIRFIEAP
jgi:hypothetical protein